MVQDKKAIYRITLTAVFAALVFVSSMLSVPIPVAIGDVTRIHLGNIFCLLSGFVLGPLAGGLAAGLGSALYDLTLSLIHISHGAEHPAHQHVGAVAHQGFVVLVRDGRQAKLFEGGVAEVGNGVQGVGQGAV